MFVNSKNYRTFAVPNFIKTLIGCVFLCTANSLYANNIGYQIPFLGNTTISFVMEFGDSGGDSLSYLYISTNKFSSKMPNSAKITSPVNNSNGASTPNGATSVVTSTQENATVAQQISGNVRCRIVQTQNITHGITKEELPHLLKALLKEFIDSGLVSVLSNPENKAV